MTGRSSGGSGMAWPSVPLVALLESLESGSRPKGGARTNAEGIPSIGGEHLDSDGSLRLENLRYVPESHFAQMGQGAVQQWDILLVKDGATTGKVALVRPDFPYPRAAVNEHVFILRVNQKVACPAYVFYFLFSSQGQTEILRDHRGATIGGISRNFASLVRVPLPPLSEQRRIVELLDQADRLRRLRAEADAKADRILPALFIKMFGDPATNPMGWPVVRVGECVAPISRRDPSDRPDEPFTYIDIAGIDGKSGAICDTKELLGADAPSRARQVIKAGDILVSTVRPYLRATAMVPPSLDGQVCSTGFCVLRPRVTYLRGYLYSLTRTTWFTDQLTARARGASYPAVTDRDILELRVPLPSDPSLLGRFDSLIETLIEQRARAGKCRTAVDQLFGTLLCRAFDGSLTVSWREAHMKELLQEMEQQAKALATG